MATTKVVLKVNGSEIDSLLLDDEKRHLVKKKKKGKTPPTHDVHRQQQLSKP